jgi:hypothetical protein
MEIQFYLDTGSTMRHRLVVIGSTKTALTADTGSKTMIAKPQAPGVT